MKNKLNCEVLLDSQGYEIRWVIDGDDWIGQLVAKIDPGDYMAFALSKNDTKSEMIGADAVVAYFDQSIGRGYAIDYHLESKQQCVGSYGSCPDIKLSPNSTDSITLLHAAVVNGFTMVTFKRPLVAVDDIYDQHIYSDGPQAICWAIGSLNERKEVSYHYNRVNKGNHFIDFTRKPKWNCPSPQSSNQPPENPTENKPTSRSAEVRTESRSISNIDNFRNVEVHDINKEVTSESMNEKDVWKIPPIVCPADKTFRVQIGPTGGKRLSQITGKVGWGVSFWINGLMAPELVVERGSTYNFIIEGGNDAVHSSRRHQFYITDSSEGGFMHKTYEEQIKEKIYAGVEVTPKNNLTPIGEGRLCVWQVNTSLPNGFEDKVSFLEFAKTLTLKCDDSSEPSIISWTPDANTPENLYYQCYSHRFLGWKIKVVDSCDHLTSASIQEDYPVRIKPNQIHYVKRQSKHAWNEHHSPLQNQQISKIKQKIRKNQNVKFQVKPTSISAPIAFESTRIRTPQSLSTKIFKEDAITHRNLMDTIEFSKVDRLPSKKQIKDPQIQFASKNVSLIPTIQDRQLIPPIITPVLSTRKLNLNRGRPRAKQLINQLNDNTITYVRQKIASLPPNLINYQIKPSKAQYLKQAQKLDLDQINLQGGFLPIEMMGYGQTLKPRKDKKLHVNLPLHLPINIPVNLPISSPEAESNEKPNLIVNTLNNINHQQLTNNQPISLALKKNKESRDNHLNLVEKEDLENSQPSTSTTTISSLIIPQNKRIMSYLSTNQDKVTSTSSSNFAEKFNSQPAINVTLKVPTTLKIPKLPTTVNPFISSLHPFTVKQIIKSMEHGERVALTTIKPYKRLNKLTIRPKKTTTTTTTTTTTPLPTTTSTTKKPINIDSINFGDLSSSSYYHSVHVVAPNKKQGSENNKSIMNIDNNRLQNNKLSNHQLGLVDYNKLQAARTPSTRVSVTKYQPNNLSSSPNQVDNAILSHVLSLITMNETPPEISLKRNTNNRKLVNSRPISDDNVNYFDNGYEVVELHEKLN